MRIATNSVSDSIVRQIQQLGSNEARLQNQVATGQRIFQPEDDPTAVGRVLDLESEQRKLSQFQRNTDRALEISQASYAGLQSLKTVSDRASEIGTLGTGAISPDAAKAYASEVDQLIEQTLQLGNSKVRNDYLFAGTKVDQPPYVATRDANGKVTTVAYAGNTDRASIQLSENASLTPNTSSDTNNGVKDFLNQLVALRDALNSGSTATISTVQTSLMTSEDQLVTALAEHGGVQTRIQASQAQLTSRSDNLESLVSKETDADLPSTVVQLNRAQTAYQAALQSAANIMKISLLDYIH